MKSHGCELAPLGAQRPQSTIFSSTSRPTWRPFSKARTLRRRRTTCISAS
jgi:hypothetical protein